jgi:hypothetical protein
MAKKSHGDFAPSRATMKIAITAYSVGDIFHHYFPVKVVAAKI